MLPNVSDPTEYGLPFKDYDSNGVVDHETEQTAAQYEKHAVDVAALSHTCPRAIAVCSVAGGVVTVDAYRSVWGDTAAVYPRTTYNGPGDYTLTWLPAGYPDLNPTVSRQVTRAPAFIAGHVNVYDTAGGLLRSARVMSVTANTARVLTFDESGAADDFGFMLFMY